MDINFIDETKKVTNEQLCEVDELLQFAADYLKLGEDTEISVSFMDNQAIQIINREYRAKDMPTDVISFALEEEGMDEAPIFFDEEGSPFPRNLGDILISTEQAFLQAQEYGHSYERELGFLAIHGFLHLNGYDHIEKAQEKEMFELQEEILAAYGLKR